MLLVLLDRYNTSHMLVPESSPSTCRVTFGVPTTSGRAATRLQADARDVAHAVGKLAISKLSHNVRARSFDCLTALRVVNNASLHLLDGVSLANVARVAASLRIVLDIVGGRTSVAVRSSSIVRTVCVGDSPKISRCSKVQLFCRDIGDVCGMQKWRCQLTMRNGFDSWETMN